MLLVRDSWRKMTATHGTYAAPDYIAHIYTQSDAECFFPSIYIVCVHLLESLYVLVLPV